MMQTRSKDEVRKQQATKAADLTLMIARLEREVIEGADPDRCRLVLARDSLWKNAASDVQLKLAGLAQMAGETESALRVLAHINRTDPAMSAAWLERIELLSILERKKELLQVLAMARTTIGEDRYHSWMNKISDPASDGDDGGLETVAAPFKNLQRRQEAIATFLALFAGRQECFARQWVDKDAGRQGYVPVRHPMGPADVEDHLAGRRTSGIYILQADSRVKTAVLDVDLQKQFRSRILKAADKALVRREQLYLLKRVRELAEEMGLEPLAEFSGGKGYHFWFFFDPPVEAAAARNLLGAIKNVLSADLSAFELEVFPKQDSLSGKGLGNLVKLPLGIHRMTGKRSYFLDCSDHSTEAQLDMLSRLRPVELSKVRIPAADAGKAAVVVHPRFEKWAAEFPELYALEHKCPPIAQVIAACRNGGSLSVKEEKVIFQTVGFLPRAKTLLHHLAAQLTDYNPHLVDFKLSRLRGTPLGCRRIHSLLGFTGDHCRFSSGAEYAHPLLHLDQWSEDMKHRSEKAQNLEAALENLTEAIARVRRFLK